MRTFLMSVLMIITTLTMAQKGTTTLATNLNSSKSNIYRIVYPTAVIKATQAVALGKELDMLGAMDSIALRTWLAANFKRLGIRSDHIVLIAFITERQFRDCTICKQYCKGRCVQDPGSDCICIQHSEPNLREMTAETNRQVIFLSDVSMSADQLLEAVASTVKSSKSNSSD